MPTSTLKPAGSPVHGLEGLYIENELGEPVEVILYALPNGSIKFIPRESLGIDQGGTPAAYDPRLAVVDQS